MMRSIWAAGFEVLLRHAYWVVEMLSKCMASRICSVCVRQIRSKAKPNQVLISGVLMCLLHQFFSSLFITKC